ncbi:MAG: hypothetical protein ACI8V4_002454 [Ilumatobacter sp.]
MARGITNMARRPGCAGSTSTPPARWKTKYCESSTNSTGQPSHERARSWLQGRVRKKNDLEQLFCAEVVAITYERMGLLESKRPSNWYDLGKFWSGDRLELIGATLGPKIAVTGIDHPAA